MWLFLQWHLFFLLLCYTAIIVLNITSILMGLLLLRLCSKEFNLAPKEIWSLPSAPRRQAPSPWNVLPSESVFCLPGVLGHARQSNSVIQGWGFGSYGTSSISGGTTDLRLPWAVNHDHETKSHWKV